MPSDRSGDEDARGGLLNRVLVTLPVLPTPDLGAIVWIHLGVAFGGLAVEYGALPTEYVIWGAILVAATCQIGGAFN